ncbi:MAG: glutamate mutase L [Candidatus Cloacimonetes bacterium]|nr:glutamate mutase L [Candidatus Cloacimonadota bacterium]
MKDIIVITDIGSTTTKAMLLKKVDDNYKFIGYTTAFTTVEKPNEDVKIGIFNSLRSLEELYSVNLIKKNQKSSIEQKVSMDISSEIINQDKISSYDFLDNVTYLTTSSAGGGLQILVVGLTKADSASSAERAAYGVGGVILDTLAIDDGKTSIERMEVFNQTHPDIILFCGGIDGGALFSVYRLAEILKLANPTLKFSDKVKSNQEKSLIHKIPLVFAGNKDVIDFIKIIFENKFDLHIVPNLRPTMIDENLEPTKEKIHELFMNNVMEQAPGYSKVKEFVSTDIIPTPSGVLKSLKILGNKYSKVIAFDIGGATTDVYSNLNGNYHRTVSANFGMSYSIGNILAETNDYLIKIIIQSTSIINKPHFYEYFLNYLGNKIIYPDFQPTHDIDKFIEHIVAIQGIRLSLKQHFKMHFMTKRIGFLDFLKHKPSRDKWKETMYYPHYDKSFIFNKSDIEVAIGAGGIISHATKEQALYVMIESLQLEGITELWRDKHFISPHLGVLSCLDEKTAEQLLYSDCFEKLGIYLRPFIRSFKENKILLTINIDDQDFYIKTNEFFYHTTKTTQKICISSTKDCNISISELNIQAGLPLIIDTRNREEKDLKSNNTVNNTKIIIDSLKPYIFSNIEKQSVFSKTAGKGFIYPVSIDQNQKYLPQKNILHFALPYKGSIFVNNGDIVRPDTLLGENRFDPPKIYVVLISTLIGKTLTEKEFQEGILIKVDDKISSGDKIFRYKSHQNLFKGNEYAYSPVRGFVEQINSVTGSIIMREIQDYPTKPVMIDAAKKLKIKEKYLKGYLKKQEGDFVYKDDILGVNQVSSSLLESPEYITLLSPYTGTIQKIDSIKGTITICYDKKPYQMLSLCHGLVENITENNEIFISVETIDIFGKIGFGKDVGGFFRKSDIEYVPHIENYQNLQSLAEKSIKGLICNTITYSCLKQFLNKDIGVALTGSESIPFSLIILNGFSDKALMDDTNFFQQFENRYILIKPHTQIRAGATRPTLLIFNETCD